MGALAITGIAWIDLLFWSLVLMVQIVCGGYVVARTGRSPMWVMLLLFPFLNVTAIWALAFVSWPRTEQDAGQEGEQGLPDARA